MKTSEPALCLPNARGIISQREYRALLRRHMPLFVERAFYELHPQGGFVPGRHIDLICAKLDRCLQGNTRRLIVCLPPRSLKSLIVSVACVAFVLGHRPSTRFICASYGQELADKHARDCRVVMGSSWYKETFPTRLSDERHAAYDFETTENGGRMATSVGGSMTGRGADWMIIDDVIKPDDALSDVRRSTANEWFFNTAQSRLNDKGTGVVIVVMQRLHQDDLVGNLVERGEWDVLSLPAIAEEDERHEFEDVLGKHCYERKPGDLLHPEREHAGVYSNIRKQIGEYNFQSQYQQRPTPVSGNLVKRHWLQLVERSACPAFVRVVQSWDTANKAGELNDYSVGTIWGVSDGRFYLLEVIRKRLNYPDLRRTVVETVRRYEGEVPVSVLIEDKASGTQLLQDLQQELAFNLVPYKPIAGMDKIMRMNAQSATIENGRVFLVKDTPWLQDYINELIGFPGMKYDDQVDSTTQALAYMAVPDPLDIWVKLAG